MNGSGTGSLDSWAIWRSSIEDDEDDRPYGEAKHKLVTPLRQMLERYFDARSRDGGPLGHELDELLADDPAVDCSTAQAAHL
jgi:hypothetical protein